MIAEQILTKRKIRPTPARVAILSLLQKSLLPVSVPELEETKQVKKLAIDTVTLYRMMDTYVEAGIVERLELQEGKFRYELTGRSHHHHAICTNCGMIVDVADCIEDKVTKKVEKKTGFKIVSHSLSFYGLCKKCRKK